MSVYSFMLIIRGETSGSLWTSNSCLSLFPTIVVTCEYYERMHLDAGKDSDSHMSLELSAVIQWLSHKATRFSRCLNLYWFLEIWFNIGSGFCHRQTRSNYISSQHNLYRWAKEIIEGNISQSICLKVGFFLLFLLFQHVYFLAVRLSGLLYLTSKERNVSNYTFLRGGVQSFGKIRYL